MKHSMREIAFSLKPWKTKLYVACRSCEFVETVAPFSAIGKGHDTFGTLFLVQDEELPALLAFTGPINVLLCSGAPFQIDISEHPNLNILVLLEPADTQTVYSAVIGILMDKQPQNISQILLDALNSEDKKALVSTIEGLFGNPIIIYDSSYGIVATSKCNLFSSENAIHQFDLDGTCFDNDKETAGAAFIGIGPGVKKTAIVAPVFIMGIVSAYMFIVEENVRFDESDLKLADTACKAVAVELKKSDIYRISSGLRYEYFLVKLIENKTKARQFIDARIKNLNLTINGKIFIGVFQIPREYLEKNYLLKRLSRELRELCLASLSAVYKEYIVLLFTRDTIEPLSAEMEERLDTYLAGRGILGGISQPFYDLVNAYKYYRQALDALALSQLCQRKGSIHKIQDNMLTELFSFISFSCDLRDYISPKISRLVTYDGDNGTLYADTLKILMDTCMNIKLSAEKMFIHRNTMLYRLNKIKEITGLDFDLAEDNFQAQFSLRILEFLALTEQSGQKRLSG